MRTLSLAVCAACLLLSTSAYCDEKIDAAVKFLKEACVTSGSSFEVKAVGKGTFQVRRLLGSGVAGSVSLDYKQMQGLADAASAANSQQASEMRACMKPYIDRILSVQLQDARK